MTDQTPQKPQKHAILLVDDEPEILYSLKGLLHREFELYTAESAKEALEILQQHPIHVVMTDQRMPEMSGVELMGRVKNRYPDAIRIVFTGYADIRAVVDAINSGGLFRYITKPWDPDELVETLRAAAAEYDRRVEWRELLERLRAHVEEGRKLAEGLRQADHPAVGSVDIHQFHQAAQQLLQRLDNVIPS